MIRLMYMYPVEYSGELVAYTAKVNLHTCILGNIEPKHG